MPYMDKWATKFSIFSMQRGSVLPENVKFFLLYLCTTTSFLLPPKLAGILQGIELIRGSIQRANTEEAMYDGLD
jgi:hypothetical protein